MTSTAISPARGISPPPRFPDLLRTWRKLRKLSQWDLSLTAGISQRHLSFLESGRSSPSREMVLRLADSLEIPLREQNNLLGSAGFAPMYRESKLEADVLAQAREALSVMLRHHEPYPCLVVDSNWNMLMSNEANIRLFSLFVDPLNVWADIEDKGTQNLARLMMHPKGIRPYVKNWDIFAGYFMQGLQHNLRVNPYDLETRALLEEIAGYPDVPEVKQGLSETEMPFLAMQLEKNDVQLSIFTMVSTFGSPHDVTLQHLRIETFFPADEASEKLIRSL